MNLDEYKGSEARHVLVYGPPKTGKTELVGALAKHYTLWWFDLDGGAKTLLRASSAAAGHLKNIRYFRIPDSQTFPIAIETMLKVIKGGKKWICFAHGKVECPVCKKEEAAGSEINLDEFKNDRDILVIDTFTQLMDSCINYIFRDQLKNDDWDNLQTSFHDWRKQGAMSDRFGTTIQNAPWNCVVISHEVLTEMEDGSKKIAPVGGTRNKSADFGRYFDDIVYTDLVGGKFVALSHQSDKTRTVLGSRTGKKLQGPKGEQLGLVELFK